MIYHSLIRVSHSRTPCLSTSNTSLPRPWNSSLCRARFLAHACTARPGCNPDSPVMRERPSRHTCDACDASLVSGPPIAPGDAVRRCHPLLDAPCLLRARSSTYHRRNPPWLAATVSRFEAVQHTWMADWYTTIPNGHIRAAVAWANGQSAEKIRTGGVRRA